MNFKKKNIKRLFHTHRSASDKEKESDEFIWEEIDFYMVFKLLHLPVSKITLEFENKIKSKIDQNILNTSIRKGNEEDLENLVYMYNHAWRTSNTPFSKIASESFANLYDSPGITIFIAKVNEIDAGFIILDFEGTHNEYGIIAGLGIIPRFQRRGIGTLLGMKAWNFFKKRGVIELRCEVYEKNQASYKFIKSMGFEEYGTVGYKPDDFN